MRKKLTFVAMTSNEEEAREKALEWFAHLKNLSVDSVSPYPGGGYQVWISYDD